ncbi:E3 ubiquitin-protein ligase TRIM56-like [Sycon ciliatum]|uniref:E3 ubiquitin-protein ligase TRIM56-like n=1 Tax=Sycon ciliatum TaxID=27933 RepID=UPI0031F6806F
MCDECVEDTEAVSTCLDCMDKLCEDHAKGHSTSRRSYKHKVVALGESGADTAQQLPQSSGSNSCPIHPSSKQSRFCMACCKILCGICEESHGGHCDAIMPIEEAASKAREELKAEVAASFSNDGKGIQELLDKVEAASAHLHQDTEAVSSQIKEFFTRTKALLDTRQQELLDQLYQLQPAHHIPLQELKRHLLSGLSTGKKLMSLIESCHDDSNFMRMYGWLKEAAQEVQSAARRNVQPCVPDTLMFAPCMADTLNEVI